MTKESGQGRPSQLGFFDFIAALAESWLILILLPLAVGVGVYFLTKPKPVRWESYIEVAVSPASANVILSPSIRSSVFGQGKVDPRQKVTTQATLDPNVSLIVAAAPTSSQSSTLAENIRSVAESGYFADKVTMSTLQRELDRLREATHSLRESQESLEAEFKAGGTSWTPETYARALSALIDERTHTETRIGVVERGIANVPSGALVSVSDAPVPIMNSKRIAVPFAIIGTAIAVIICVILLEVFRGIRRNRAYEPQISRIRAVLRHPFHR